MKYLKIREQKTRYGSSLFFQLCNKKDEKDCYYIKLELKQKRKKLSGDLK